MKRILMLFICALFVTTSAFAGLMEDVMSFESNDNSQKVEVAHDKNSFIQKGRYIYKVDKNGNLLGYYKNTSGGNKVTVYDMDGNALKSYRMSPSGKLIIYNSKGNRIN